MCLMLCQRSLRQSSLLFILFPFFCSVAVIYTNQSVFQLTYSFFCLIYSALPSRDFSFQVLYFFISVYLFFKSSSSLLNIYLLSLYIHSVSVSEILDHLHYHYSEFFLWKIVYLCFTQLFFWGFCLLCLEHMPYRTYAISFCQTFCVCGICSAGCRTIVLLVSGVCHLVSEVGPEVFQGFLVELVPDHWLKFRNF